MPKKSAASAERFAGDLSKADVAELLGWVRGQLDQADPTARALEVFLGESAAVLNLSIELRDATRPQDGFTELAHLQAIRREWNQLVRVARPWRDRPGYDPTRWDAVQTNAYFARGNHESEQRAMQRLRAEQEAADLWSAAWRPVNARLVELGVGPAEPEDCPGMTAEELAQIGQLTLTQTEALLRCPAAAERSLEQRLAAWIGVNARLAELGLEPVEVIGAERDTLPDGARAQCAVLTLRQAVALRAAGPERGR
ncbi:hypothetical protein ACIRPK_09160 [Kitasatospora sp. NPDC101801]|uniref:hypothetical protein n=1 Tax=Kitasatospora sp. NPDC101801 TaxID=3364103 RepID=UPI003801BBDC